MPPCLAVARDPEGSFTPATAEGGGLDRVSAATFAYRRCVSHLKSALPGMRADAAPSPSMDLRPCAWPVSEACGWRGCETSSGLAGTGNATH